MTNELKFKCSDCGSEDFVHANSPNIDKNMVFCGGCKKQIGTLEDIKKATAAAQAIKLHKLRAQIFSN